MRTHDQVVAKLMRRPGVRKEVERIAALARQVQAITIGKIPRVAPRAACDAARSLDVLSLDDDDIDWDAMPAAKRAAKPKPRKAAV